VQRNGNWSLLRLAKYSDIQGSCGAGWHPARRLATGAGRPFFQASEGGLSTRRRLPTCPTSQHRLSLYCAKLNSSESEWLRELAAARAEATLVAQVKRTAAQALNVTAKIAGSNLALAPLVFMAPRSAWWQSATEQGSRLACWLEAIGVLAAGKPARDCLFIALRTLALGPPLPGPAEASGFEVSLASVGRSPTCSDRSESNLARRNCSP
jgi:hypothetical protein